MYKRQSKKRAEDTEKEEGGQEQEIEVFTDSEMEQQTGDKEETEVITDTEKETVEEKRMNFYCILFLFNTQACLLYTSRCV